MRRREFITLLGAAAVASPPVAHAQQGDRVRRIGVLLPAPADDSEYQARVAAFQQGLALLGWNIGRNVRIDARWTGASAAEIRKHAAELVALAPDVILTSGAARAAPLLQATRTVPIVFTTVSDPVAGGLVDSLARPGGNATGFMLFHERNFVAAGGLISYGPNWIDQYRRAAGYVNRILKGEKPADLPVQAPIKYETVLNLKTAKALGLDIPASVFARADEVIE